MGFLRTLLDMRSGLSLSHHLWERKGRREHIKQKFLPYNPDFYTCSPSLPTIWERKERKGRVDVTMIKTRGGAVR